MANYAPVQETLAAPAGPPIDPDVLDQRRKLAQALIAQAMGGEPIGSWTQGVAKLAQALMGGYNVRRTNQQEAAGRASGAADTAAALAAMGGGATGGATGGAYPMISETSGGVADPDAMTPEEAIVRTVAGEAAGEPAEGQAAVASVILNRAKKAGQSPQQIVLAKNQFEPWSRNPQRLMALTRDSPKYQQILANIQPALQGQDVTGGATHFYAPKAQAALGRNTPAWARGPYQDIGNHRFFKLAGGPTGQTAALPNVQPVGSAPSPDVEQFLGQPQPQPLPSLEDRRALLRQVLTGAKESPADVAAEVHKYYGNEAQQPLGGEPMAAAPSPGVMAFIGGGGDQAQPAGLSIGDGAAGLPPPSSPVANVPVDPRVPQPRPDPFMRAPPPPLTTPLPPEHPLARAPQPRPAPPAPPAPPAAAAPATTASIPQPQPRRQIFRELSGAPLSAQEFARQGQNYLTGRGSFADQTARVAPRTMQEPIAGTPAGAPAAPVAAAAPAQPRRGLLAALLGRGGPQAPAAAQAAPAGSPVAAGATAAAPADSPLARLIANPYVDPAIKAAVFARAFPKDKPYVNVPAGGTVYDPNTNKPLFTSPAKPEKPPSAVQEYEYAKSQGFKGSFEEWELQQKRAGAQPIIVGAGEKSYTVERGKLLAKQFGDIQDAGIQAQGRMGTLDAMEQALGKTSYTGWGAPQLLEVKRASKLLGIDTGDTGAAETAQAISNQLAMQLRNPSGGAGMPGAMSDADRNFLKASVLGIERTPEANAKLLDYNRRLEQRSIDVAQQASEYAAAHGGLLDDGFGSELAKWAKANPLFPEAKDTPVPSKSGTTSGGVKWSVEP